MYLLGYDIGSSSVKAALVDAGSGRCVASAYSPDSEAPIRSVRPGFAEQDPADWWSYLQAATAKVLSQARAEASARGRAFSPADIRAVGISYQMHGLVCVDRDLEVLRPAIIWCDSRAVPYGEKAAAALGGDWCLEHLLNAPGNFTAAKLAWVKENEPALFARISKVMLPGDYIALRLTGTLGTTVGGLSEGIFWDFRENRPSERLLAHFGFDADLLPPVLPTFGPQGRLTASAAAALGLAAGTPVTYRAGDQPNNALSLNVLEPGEVAATAGTSGVVYGVSGEVNYDPLSRVNTFAHVNHAADRPRLGILLCVNGAGIVNAWARRNVCPDGIGYGQMNDLAATVAPSCDGLRVLPFGNGAERMLGNRNVGCSVHGLDVNRHGRAHLLRAVNEAVAFSFKYGMDIMAGMGMQPRTIRAGKCNMFLNPSFREALAGTTGATIELYDTDGAVGAARGAGMGAGVYRDAAEAFSTLERLEVVEPACCEAYAQAYASWKELLDRQ